MDSKYLYSFSASTNVEGKKAIIVEADTIDAESMICLLKKVEAYYPSSEHLYVFADNTRYRS